MEKALLPEREKGEDVETRQPLIDELKKVTYIALPMIIVTVSQYLLRAAPVIMLGHIDELYLASSSIATSFCNVTGFSLILGMSSALETLCGQAYGAGQHKKLGSYTYCGIISLILVCIPVSILWIFIEDILIFVGQDVVISREAGNYAIWLILTLFPYAILQSLNRFLQTQSLILPMLLTSIISICFHLPVCWAFIFKLNLGNAGAALSIGLSYSLNTILLVFYVKYSPTCENTWVPFSADVFGKIGEFYRFAIPSAVMVCLEWWSFELVILFSGLLPNPQLETSVLSICLNITSLHYFIPYSFAVAVSTRVSNELGAGNPQRARIALCVVVVLACSEFLLASAILFCFRFILGYGFSNEKEVVDYVRDITPLLCLSIIVDSIQTVLSGVSRGSGWQHIGAYINLGSYYIVGIPLSLVLGFVFRLKGPGLWIGLLAGSTTQAALLSLITCLSDWRKQATEARERALAEQSSSLAQMLE
ncbi:transporter [Lithospermum erythrorhizon]|uniref:Protein DETOXIFICATION n=1 Tax=Lithospermum erythrorhizon TaxID=34254 RepID=A0AAV3RE99_LITER